MKIRILSLCFLLLVSVTLIAQTDKKGKEKAKEKEAAELVDKKDRAKKEAKKAAKEAAKLAEQESKKNQVNWQNIPKLVVPPGGSFQLKSNFLQVDTLIMHPSSTLALAQGDNVMVIGHATVGPGAKILGRGKSGTNGSNGRSGEPAPQLPGARDGGKGSNGGDGQNAPDLKLFLGGINRGGRLGVTLLGGTGGRGGNGGDGGTKKIQCQPKPTGTNGGDAGAGGSGGAGGELILVMGEGVNNKAINYRSITGKSGTGGDVGNAGLVIMTCTGYGITRSRPGNSGLFNNPRIIESPPNTNPNFLEFPNPVPTPSALDIVPIKIPEDSSYGTVDTKLRSALSACGYRNLHYRSFQDGFAIFTGIEHITSEGVPLAGKNRFSPEKVIFYNDPSFISYLKSLFNASIGYSRIIVFIVSSEDIGNEDDGGVARAEAITWLKSSLVNLPSELKNRTFTKKHKLSALIYEFSKEENTLEPVFSEPSLIGVDQHLKGANLWPLLTKD